MAPSRWGLPSLRITRSSSAPVRTTTTSARNSSGRSSACSSVTTHTGQPTGMMTQPAAVATVNDELPDLFAGSMVDHEARPDPRHRHRPLRRPVAGTRTRPVAPPRNRASGPAARHRAGPARPGRRRTPAGGCRSSCLIMPAKSIAARHETRRASKRQQPTARPVKSRERSMAAGSSLRSVTKIGGLVGIDPPWTLGRSDSGEAECRGIRACGVGVRRRGSGWPGRGSRGPRRCPCRVRRGSLVRRIGRAARRRRSGRRGTGCRARGRRSLRR